MAAARVKKEKPPAGPDDLVRDSGGVYHSGDGRFEVQKSDAGWYVVDTAQANEFGQQLIHGPLPTLDAVRAAIPGARDIKPLLRTRMPSATKGKPPTPSSGASKANVAPSAPPPAPAPPPSWIDRLSTSEAAGVRRLIKALDKEGLRDAESLVRRHHDGAAPLIATSVVEHRLRALVSEQPETERERAQQIVRRVVEILAIEGATVPQPLRRWALIEVKPDDELPRDRIKPDV
jgi:hypothetical protein